MKTALFLVVVLLLACSPQRPLPVYGQIPGFTLTAETGHAFESRTLDGRVWVADFIYTTCTGPCPRMTSLMRQLQTLTANLPQVRLVSMTVDPQRDTPEVLAAYARRNHAQPERWRFLTGGAEALHHLKREAFKLGSVDGSLNHSTRLVLVDGRGRIRGYYGTDEDSPIQRLLTDIKRLLQEPS
ncbi:MAG: SCO family protein [Acidobacteria bacterium]|nr:SCO family protein [Acidobacteriota bacterium]MBI3473768.1 SCO family protein [Candidatus Solibacter usitatus]